MSMVIDKLRWDSAFWRSLAARGASRGPDWLQRWSPAPIGLAFAAWPTRRRAFLRRRLREILGPRPAVREATELARAYMNFAHSLADSLAMAAEPAGEVQVEAHGVRWMNEALARGHGVILGTAHTAGWEVALAALRRYCSAPIAVIMRKERDGAARNVHGTLSASANLTVIEVGDDPLAPLPLVAHLRHGGIVAVQMDRCPPGVRSSVGVGEGVAWTLPAGPFLLSAATRAPIVLVLSARTGFRAYETLISSPIDVPRRPDSGALAHAANEVADELVRFVRAHPSQWFGFEE